MAVKVGIPRPLRKLTQGLSEAKTIRKMVATSEQKFSGTRERLMESGKIQRAVNIFVNSEDIRFFEGEETELRGGDEVSIIPAVAGGGRGWARS